MDLVPFSRSHGMHHRFRLSVGLLGWTWAARLSAASTLFFLETSQLIVL